MTQRKVYAKQPGMAPCPGIQAAIYATRVRLNLTQPQMAALIGFERRTLRQVECGARAPSSMLLLKLGAMAAGEERKTIIEELRKHFGPDGSFVRDLFRGVPPMEKRAAA